MRPAASASETLFSTTIVFVVGGLCRRSKLRYAHGVHPSYRDIPIHLAVALAVTLPPGPDRIVLTRLAASSPKL
jgi:hypothetical protein